MTLNLHEDGLILCEYGVGLSHGSLGARAAWEVENDADVEENGRTESMMVIKSRVEIMIYCGEGAEVLGPTTSIGVVLGAEGSRSVEDAGAVGNGAGT